MKKLLALCVFVALSGAAMATEGILSTSFKGTVDVKFDWVNGDADTNCNDWDNYAAKYDAYLVLCYEPILCPVCPFNVDEAALWLVDKKSKEVFFADYDNGGIVEVAAFCFGDGNVGVMITTFIPNFTLPVEDPDVAFGNTSPEVTFVLSGKRTKLDKNGVSTLLNLDGGIAFENIQPRERTTETELSCDDGTTAIFATVSLKKQNVSVKADPYCLLCSADCEEVVAATWSKVTKATKKYYWWSVEGENTLIPYGSVQ